MAISSGVLRSIVKKLSEAQKPVTMHYLHLVSVHLGERMPKDFFKFEAMTELDSVPAGSHIYLIGICGVAMGQLAVALAKLGYTVSGSDREFYEPMGSFLKKAGLRLHEGYRSENIPADAALVVIGNAISYGHPEVDVVEQKNLPYTCFPKLLHETIIAGKHSIVVTGTHGKSTTTAMIAHVLRALELDPSYFIGGVVESFVTSLQAGSGSFCVVEGDEYDDVFFSKQAKFMHYKPNTCIINAIEFDHADLYDSIETIAAAFTNMLLKMQQSDRAICCIDFPEVTNRIQMWKAECACSFITFGESPDADYCITKVDPVGLSQRITFTNPAGNNYTFTLPAPGIFNARNALAAIIACIENNLDPEQIFTSLANFSTVRRRQEVRYKDEAITVIEDFAHHPTAVAGCLQAMRAAFPASHIRAVFEPRSNTSRRAIFKDSYIEAFKAADSVLLCEVQARAVDSGQELLDVSYLAAEVLNSGTHCKALPGADAILSEIIRTPEAHEVIIVMSNGAFGGLIQKLVQHLEEKQP